ncbi:MAG: MGMT family protein [Sphingomonadaceae bacterium]
MSGTSESRNVGSHQTIADDPAFNQQVYEIVARIPRGKVTTYGAIAEALGDRRKAREVGWALYAKPRDVDAPAHRVINREGKLTGGWAFGSPDVQRGLLEAEGVTFLPDDRVDLRKHLWKPEGCASGEEGQPRLF